MIGADLILPDSGFMVVLWRLLRRERINRISGLTYLKELLGRAAFRGDRSVFWIVPDEKARDQTLRWLKQNSFPTTTDDCYIAPMYRARVEDPVLIECIQSRRATHVVIALSGGVQEKLGYYLRENCIPAADRRPPTSDLSQPAAIHCIGAALGFITGYQVAIPAWADRFYLGWLFRLIANPRKFLPRALSALALPWLILRYGNEMPKVKG